MTICDGPPPTSSPAGSPVERFSSSGMVSASPAARSLTIAMIAALEGAFVLARALRDPEPLRAAGASVATAVRQALDEAADSR